MAKIYSLDCIPVGTMDELTSDHKILVNDTDNEADYLLNKQAPTTQIGFIEDPQNPGKFLVLLDKTNPDAPAQGAGLLRVITPFSTQEIDSEYTGLDGTQNKSNILFFPITISIGEIKGFSLICKNQWDVAYFDRIQIAILSNTVNSIAGAKMEFFAQYGYGDGRDNIIRGDDWKSFSIEEGSTYNGINDLTCNYHFVALFLHIDPTSEQSSTRGVLAKSKTGSPIVEVGCNTNYCGQEQNQETMLRSDLINYDTGILSSTYHLQTNLASNFPYIEFYQVRGS